MPNSTGPIWGNDYWYIETYYPDATINLLEKPKNLRNKIMRNSYAHNEDYFREQYKYSMNRYRFAASRTIHTLRKRYV